MAKSSVPDELAKPPLRNIWNDAMGDLSGSQFKAIEKAFKKDLLPKALDAWPEAFPDPGQMKAKMRVIDSAIKEIQKAIKDASGLDDKGKKVLNKALIDVGKELEKREKLADEMLKPKKAVILHLKLEDVLVDCKSFDVLEEEGLIAGGPFCLLIDLKLPCEPGKEPPDAGKIEREAQKRLDDVRKQLIASVEDGLKRLVTLYEDDNYKDAKKCIESVNDFAEKLLEQTPSEVRQAAAKASDLRASDFETINDLTVKTLTIPRGAFDSDTAANSDAEEKRAGTAAAEGKNYTRELTDECLPFLLYVSNSDKKDAVLYLGRDTKPHPDWTKNFTTKPAVYEGELKLENKELIVISEKIDRKAMESAIDNQVGKQFKLKFSKSE